METLDKIVHLAEGYTLPRILLATGFLKSLTFFRANLAEVEAIRGGHNSLLATARVRLHQLNLSLIALHYVLLYALNDTLSPRQHALHPNWVLANGLPPWFSLFVAAYILFSNHVLSLLYFKNNRIVCRILRLIFLHQAAAEPDAMTGISSAMALIISNFRSSRTTTTTKPTRRSPSSSVAGEMVNEGLFDGNVSKGQVFRYLQLLALSSVNLLCCLFMPVMCK